MIIKILSITGNFAENKDSARDIRTQQILPALKAGEDVVLDFGGVDSTTQSFIHALISELMREYGSEVLERITFKDCKETIKKLIEIVVDYMQQTE